MLPWFSVVRLRVLLSGGFIIIAMTAVYSQVPVKLRSTVGQAGASLILDISGRPYLVQQSIGQDGVTGKYKTSQGLLFQGFIQPFRSQIFEQAIPELKAAVYPNPFSTSITLSFQNQPNTLSIIITDMLGRVVFENRREINSQMVLNLEHLSRGQYLLRLVNLQQQSIVKLIKE